MDSKSEKKLDFRNSVCYFGTYEKEYPRNSIMIKGLRKNNVNVIECHIPYWEKTEDKTGKFIKSKFKIFWNVLKSYVKLTKKYIKSEKSKTIIVGYPGQTDIFLARILAPRKRIIFNPMISMYDTIISDRQMFKANSLSAKILLLIDKASCKLANIIIVDTPEHARYFKEKIGVDEKKLKVVPVGADDEIFFPEKNENVKKIEVLFYGKFTPIHGTEYLLKCAKLLEKYPEIEFTIIGKGQTYEKDMELYRNLNIKNIRFIDWIPYEELSKTINQSTICLGGHFGIGDKARRVIANKTFQMIACKKPVIISDSIASIEGGFVNEKNSLFCKQGDEKEIAELILKLSKDKKLRNEIAKNAYELFKKEYSIDAIGKKTLEIIESGNK